jgi:hypothetical protein
MSLDIEKVKALYGECKLYGPYTSKKDGRKRCVLTFDRCSKKTTLSYPKLLLETNLGRRLGEDETVDHIDADHSNNVIGNLQILTRIENAKKSHVDGTSNTNAFVAYSRSEEGRRRSSERMKAHNANPKVRNAINVNKSK